MVYGTPSTINSWNIVEHDGDSRVPKVYPKNLALGVWCENQRVLYRRKHTMHRLSDMAPATADDNRSGNGSGKSNQVLSDLKEELLNELDFVWDLQPPTRNDDAGIAIMYGCAVDNCEEKTGVDDDDFVNENQTHAANRSSGAGVDSDDFVDDDMRC